MDTDWFAARMAVLGIVQEDIARGLRLDRSTVSRIQSGLRPLTLAEVEPLAAIMQVPPIEVIEHAHTWRIPIRAQAEIRVDLMEIAVSCAMAALSDSGANLAQEVARHAVAIYGQLVDSEANGQPIASDERAMRLIVDTLRRVRAASHRRSD